MTNQEAKEQAIASICYGCQFKNSTQCSDKYECKKAIDIIDSVFEKQVPKQAIKLNDTFWKIWYWACPVCKSQVVPSPTTYCNCCGQKLELWKE